jgi:ubiquinone/menaquinone biosynthesis C-methylase UbiE
MPAGLSVADVEAVYDRVGRAQDAQRFYEAPALRALRTHAAFHRAEAVFEVGCGTGRLAADLLRDDLPPSATYRAVDLSATMVEIAQARLASFADRASVWKTDGRLRFDCSAGGADRVVAAYVLDLLSQREVRTFLKEAHRLLAPSGSLCVTGLTDGRDLPSRVVASLWRGLHRARPAWVGGCRPLCVRAILAPDRWRVVHHEVVTPWGVPSEVLVARPL